VRRTIRIHGLGSQGLVALLAIENGPRPCLRDGIIACAWGRADTGHFQRDCLLARTGWDAQEAALIRLGRVRIRN
jgi:hypothetical protein